MWRIQWFFVEYLPKVASYACFLWHDRDWEDKDILRLFAFKLRRVREGIARYGHHIGKEKTCQEIRLAETLIARIVADEYGRLQWQKHDLKWGSLNHRFGKQHATSVEFILEREKAISEADKKIERTEFRRIFEHEQYMANQDLAYLFLHLRKHIKTWWD